MLIWNFTKLATAGRSTQNDGCQYLLETRRRISCWVADNAQLMSYSTCSWFRPICNAQNHIRASNKTSSKNECDTAKCNSWQRTIEKLVDHLWSTMLNDWIYFDKLIMIWISISYHWAAMSSYMSVTHFRAARFHRSAWKIHFESGPQNKKKGYRPLA